MSCFYLIFEQLICFLNLTLSSLLLQSILLLFTALCGMQTRGLAMRIISVCLYVRLSVCQMREL